MGRCGSAAARKPPRFYARGGLRAGAQGYAFSVLSNRALPAEDLVVAAALELLHTRFESALPHARVAAIRQRTVDQIRAQLLVARRAE